MKTNFRELVLLVTMFIAGALSCWIWLLIKQQDQNLANPCYYEHIKSLHYDQNSTGRFVFCASKEMQKIMNSKMEIKYYFKHLPKDANFTSEEQIIIDKAKRIIDDELLPNGNK